MKQFMGCQDIQATTINNPLFRLGIIVGMKVDREELVKLAAIAGGEKLLSIVPSSGIVEKEGRGNFVTAADIISQETIVALIKKSYPNDLILSEETHSNLSQEEFLKAPHLWVIDPLDGTNNFRHQRHYYSVSVAYVEDGETKAGAVYNPFSRELFYAEKGKGAFLGKRKLKIGEGTNLSQSSVCTDNSYDPQGTRYNLELILKIKPSPWIMMKGCATLEMGEVAAGKIDLFFQTCLKPWDNAAVFLIVREAGGVVKDFKGNDVNFFSPIFIAGNSHLVDQFIEITK